MTLLDGEDVARARPEVRAVRAVPSTPLPSHGPVVAAMVVYLVLALGVPLVVVDWAHDAGTSATTLLCLLLIAVSSWRLTEAIALGRRAVLRTFFHVFVYVFLAVPALAQSVSGRYPLDGLSYGPTTVLTGLGLLVAGVLAYEAGWTVAGRWRRPGEADGIERGARFAFSRGRSVVLGGVGLVCAGSAVAQRGIGTFFASRADTLAALTGSDSAPFYTAEDKTAGLVTIFLLQYLVFVALFAILYSRRHRLWPAPGGAEETGWRVLIAALLVANVVMNNPMGNGRWWFCLVAVAFASIYLPLDRGHHERYYAIGALLALFFTFASLDAFRSGAHTADLSGPASTFVANETYSMFQTVLNGVRYVETQGHTGGLQTLGAALVVVPRSLWEGKPIATGQVVDPQYVRSATMWTETHVDYGVAGLVAAFLLYGAGSRLLTQRARGVGPGLLHATLPLLATFQLFLLRGSLMPALGSLYQLFVAFACVVACTSPGSLARVLPRRRAGSAPARPATASPRPGEDT